MRIFVDIPRHYPEISKIPLFGNQKVTVSLIDEKFEVNPDGSCVASLNRYEIPTMEGDCLKDRQIIDSLCPRCGLIIKVVV